MNDLLESYALLANAITLDPFLALANAVAWLDPYWNMPNDYEYEEGNEVELALYTTRDAFPGIYAEAIEQIRCGVSFHELECFICAQINRCGIPLDCLEAMPYGIPLPAHGIELSEPDLYTERPDLARILVLFGIEPDPDDYRVEVPDPAYKAGYLLASSLSQQADERWQQLGWMLSWLFSCSGNTLIDDTDEAIAEMQPLAWDAESVAFAFEILEEAEVVLRDVEAGLALLQNDPDTMSALAENVQYIYHQLANRKDKHHEPSIRLHWRPLGGSPDGAALPDPELL